jgi:hypothetical protein
MVSGSGDTYATAAATLGVDPGKLDETAIAQVFAVPS